MRKSAMPSLFLLLALALTACGASAAEISEADYARLRDAALARPRRVIIDNDGCDVTAYPESREISLKDITDYFNAKCIGHEIDAISYTPYCVSFMMSHRSKVADLNYGRMHVKGLRNLTQWTHEQGTDGLEMASRFARENHFEIFANMRINDLHARWAPKSNYAPFMTAHPEWLVGDMHNAPPFGSWVQFNFAIPQVRERFLAIVTELLAYDVDGLVVDFCRYPVLFPSVAHGQDASEEERGIITTLMRELRALSDRIGKERGHYLLLMAKVPDGIEINKAIGIDVARFCEEKLIDILIVGSDIGRSVPFAKAVRMGQDHGVKTFLSIEAWNGANPLSKDSLELYQGLAAAAWQAKPDGLFYFNMFYHADKFDAIKATPKELLLKDKSYWGRHHSRPDYAAPCARYNRMDAVDGTWLALSTDRTAEVLLETGAEFQRNDIAEKNPAVQLILHTGQNTPEIQAAVNSKTLRRPMCFPRKQIFQVPYWDVKAGQNRIQLKLSQPASPVFRTLFKGDQIIRYSGELPWRRLWPFFVKDETERIVDNALRLHDFGSEDGQCVNFYYPISATAANLAGCFDMKVEYSDAPEAIVLRLADGKHVELITFEPRRIAFRHAQAAADFVTDDDFHHYEWAIDEDGSLSLKADGDELLRATMPMPADDQRARFTGNLDGLPYMYERSLIIGSLSEKGKGASLWKNFQLSQGTCVDGTELSLKFSEDSFLPLCKAMEQPERLTPLFHYHPEEGRLPSEAGWNSSYTEGRLKITKENTLLFDNGDADNLFPTATWQIPPELKRAGAIVRLTWQSRVIESSGNGFTLGFRIISPRDGKCRLFSVMQRKGDAKAASLSTPTASGEFSSFQAWIEIDTGHYILSINGQVVEMDTMQEVFAPPLLFMGDGSSSCEGIAELRSLDVCLYGN